MPWTTPKTWATGELVTANDLNLQLRDNLSYALEKPDTQIVNGTGTDFTTTSTSLVDVTGFSATFTKRLTSTRLLVLVRGAIASGGGDLPVYALNVNGTDYNIVSSYSGNTNSILIHSAVLTGIAAGSVTLKLRLKSTSGSTVGLYGGTARQMVVIEGGI